MMRLHCAISTAGTPLLQQVSNVECLRQMYIISKVSCILRRLSTLEGIGTRVTF